MAGLLWHELQLDRFWAERLPATWKRTRWDHVLQVLVAYRLIEPSGEWRLHREWRSVNPSIGEAGMIIAQGVERCPGRPSHCAWRGEMAV